MHIYGGKPKFYQWDLNQRVTHEGLSVGDSVHFSSMKQPNALPVTAYELDGVVVADVPNILLQSPHPIFVYLVDTSGNGRSTKREYRFPVISRPKPSDYAYTETETKTWDALNAKVEDLKNNQGEQIAQAVTAYLRDNPVSAAPPAILGEVALLAANWVGSGSLYSQVVTVEGVTENSQVDLTPSVEQLVVFYEKDLTLLTENDGGIVTVYAIGQKPTNDYNIQVTITEVSV